MDISALILAYFGLLKPSTSEDSSSPSWAIFDQIIITSYDFKRELKEKRPELTNKVPSELEGLSNRYPISFRSTEHEEENLCYHTTRTELFHTSGSCSV